MAIAERALRVAVVLGWAMGACAGAGASGGGARIEVDGAPLSLRAVLRSAERWRSEARSSLDRLEGRRAGRWSRVRRLFAGAGGSAEAEAEKRNARLYLSSAEAVIAAVKEIRSAAAPGGDQGAADAEIGAAEERIENALCQLVAGPVVDCMAGGDKRVRGLFFDQLRRGSRCCLEVLQRDETRERLMKKHRRDTLYKGLWIAKRGGCISHGDRAVAREGVKFEMFVDRISMREGLKELKLAREAREGVRGGEGVLGVVDAAARRWLR